MIKEEFERLAGYEVSLEDYQTIIEPMYMATDLDKLAFVECLNKKRFAIQPLSGIIKEMKQCAASLKETCTHYTDQPTLDKLDSLVEKYIARKYPNIDMTYRYEDKELWTCYYPARVIIRSSKSSNGPHEVIEFFR